MARAAARRSSLWNRPVGWPGGPARGAGLLLHGLASFLERVTATWPRSQRPAYVGEFHALGVQWGVPVGPDESLRTDETARFWEHELPIQMADLAAQPAPGHRPDAVVVDEAQDFADTWWDPDARCVEGPRRRRYLPVQRRGAAGVRPPAHRLFPWCR